MTTAAFWSAYEGYRDAGTTERQGLDLNGARFEFYISMGMVRARYQPQTSLRINAPATGEAVQRLAERYRLHLDFRDDSYVVMDQEGSYLGRVRPGELLVTPERLAETPALLEDLLALYA